MLKDYGTVISTRILRKPDGVSRGVGFARMESKEKCDAVINAFNGKILPGMGEWMILKKYPKYQKKNWQYSTKFKNIKREMIFLMILKITYMLLLSFRKDRQQNSNQSWFGPLKFKYRTTLLVIFCGALMFNDVWIL